MPGGEKEGRSGRKSKGGGRNKQHRDGPLLGGLPGGPSFGQPGPMDSGMSGLGVGHLPSPGLGMGGNSGMGGVGGMGGMGGMGAGMRDLPSNAPQGMNPPNPMGMGYPPTPQMTYMGGHPSMPPMGPYGAPPSGFASPGMGSMYMQGNMYGGPPPLYAGAQYASAPPPQQFVGPPGQYGPPPPQQWQQQGMSGGPPGNQSGFGGYQSGGLGMAQGGLGGGPGMGGPPGNPYSHGGAGQSFGYEDGSGGGNQCNQSQFDGNAFRGYQGGGYS